MIFSKTSTTRIALLGIFSLAFSISIHAQAPSGDGKQLFQQYCQSCHALDKKLTGPALRGFRERGPWANQAEVRKWVKNPVAYMATNAYAKALKAEYGVDMQAFPDLTDKQIDDIASYIETAPTSKPPTDGGPTGAPAEDTSGRGALIFGVISLILALVALILMQVNNNLKKLSDDKEGILRPEQVPFWRNKVYIAIMALVLFVVVGYFGAKSAINLGRQQGYQPEQPIYYSHKVHAGINQINCLYCHGSAWESKHAGIPSLNVCMNCHKSISTYEKGPDLFNEEGEKIDGTAEIQKLYKYANYEPGKPWDPSRATSPEWVKIHNLPDHVYFNHAQHVNVGKVACQTCHGNIQEMDVVEQKAELSMGWCVNCHRESKVNFNYGGANDSTGNKFYSIYEKFHNDLRGDTTWEDSKKTRIKSINRRVDSIYVKDIGGIECQKCHY